MASRSRGLSGLVNSDTKPDSIGTNELSGDDRIAEVMRIIETMDYPELFRLSELIGQAYKRKAEEAQATVIAETKLKFEQLGLSFDDVAAMQKKKKRVTIALSTPKYRSPEGKEWTGKGARPKWLKEYEEGGGNRDDYLIK